MVSDRVLSEVNEYRHSHVVQMYDVTVKYVDSSIHFSIVCYWLV